jgi:hypothetical protein
VSRLVLVLGSCVGSPMHRVLSIALDRSVFARFYAVSTVVVSCRSIDAAMVYVYSPGGTDMVSNIPLSAVAGQSGSGSWL